jgi:hypothetical protein
MVSKHCGYIYIYMCVCVCVCVNGFMTLHSFKIGIMDGCITGLKHSVSS